MIYYSIRLYIIKTEITNCLCELTKSMREKQKRLLQSVLMIAYFDPCFWFLKPWKTKQKRRTQVQSSYIAKHFL